MTSSDRDPTAWLEVGTGRFKMGAAVDPGPYGEGPARMVTVGRMLVLAEPVTVHAFATFVAATGYVTTAEVEGTGFAVDASGSRLMKGLSWRHPSVAAVQAEPGSPVEQVSWFDAFAYASWCDARLPTEAEWEYAAAVGALRPSALAHEWAHDWFDAAFHRDEQRVNPIGPPSGTERVVRSGPPARRSARRGELPDFSQNGLGFRLVRRS